MNVYGTCESYMIKTKGLVEIIQKLLKVMNSNGLIFVLWLDP